MSRGLTQITYLAYHCVGFIHVIERVPASDPIRE